MRRKEPARWLRGGARSFPLMAILLLAGCSGDGAQQASSAPPPAPEVGVYTIEAQAVTLTTELPGRTAAFRVAEVRPQVSGIVQKRLFTEGSEVKQGQQLYQIDPAPYQAALARAEANLKSAENLGKRYQRLIKTNAISRQQYDDAMAAWAAARAEVEAARINMRYTKVLAPISGRIGRSYVSEGALVTGGQPQELATVTQLDPIYVDITQPVTKMLQLQRALEAGLIEQSDEQAVPVTLTLEDGSRYPQTGALKFSEVMVDAGTGSVTLRAEFPNPDGKLLPGMFVRATVQEGVQPEAKLVPQQAVSRGPDGSANVLVVTAANTVEARRVQTLRTVGNAWLVGDGIEPGERVITEGLHRVRPGIQVNPVPAGNVELKTDFGVAAK